MTCPAKRYYTFYKNIQITIICVKEAIMSEAKKEVYEKPELKKEGELRDITARES